MKNNLVDEQQNKELRGIAQRMRNLNYQLNEGILNREEEIELEENLQHEQAIFIDKCFDYFRVSAFRKAQKKQKGWGSTSNLEVAFNGVFSDLLFIELMKNIMKPETNLENFRFGAFIVGRIENRMIDAYRRISKRRKSKDFSEQDDSLSPEEKLIVQEKIQEITEIFHRIIPEKLDRVFLRWTINNKSGNGNESIAKVFGYNDKGSVKVRKSRFLTKIALEIPKDLFIISQEISIINEFIDENQLISQVKNLFTPAQIAETLFAQDTEIGGQIFEKDLAQWILLRWRSLLNPMDMEQAHVYEFRELTDLINYQRNAMNQLIDFLKKHKIIQTK